MSVASRLGIRMSAIERQALCATTTGAIRIIPVKRGRRTTDVTSHPGSHWKASISPLRFALPTKKQVWRSYLAASFVRPLGYADSIFHTVTKCLCTPQGSVYEQVRRFTLSFQSHRSVPLPQGGLQTSPSGHCHGTFDDQLVLDDQGWAPA